MALDAYELLCEADKERAFAEGFVSENDGPLERAWLKFVCSVQKAAGDYMKVADRVAARENRRG